jgi:CRP-like cAMP-binding protein
MYLHPLMAGLPPAERAALVQRSRPRSYKRNEAVVTAGESIDQIVCVASGLLRVITPGHDDGADVTTEFIRRDDFFFDLSMRQDRYESRQTLVAALPSSVYLLPIATMRGLCTRYPEVALGLLSLAMKRMSMLRGQLRRISALPAEDLVRRVLHQLTYLAPAGTSGYDKRITQAVIASYSGLSREVVNKTMRDFESRGLVRREEDGVHVTGDFAATDFGAPPREAETAAKAAPAPLVEFADGTVFGER